MLLILTDYHFNEVKGGGPAVSLRNLTQKLGVDTNYLFAKSNPESVIGAKRWSALLLMKEVYQSDLVYCNSLFSFKSGIIPVIFAVLFRRKVIVSPRGELLQGKLSNKFLKKRLFLVLFARVYRLSNVTIHFTSFQEELEGLKILGKVKSFLASNMVEEIYPVTAARKKGRVIWYSRISKEKNLHLAVEIFMASSIPSEFHIYGPIGDSKYFKRIMSLIKGDSRIVYKGVIDRDNLRETLHAYDMLLFPTPAENFGHVIIEAIQSGLFVLSGNNIPFDFSGSNNCGVALSINDVAGFTECLDAYYLDHNRDLYSWKGFLDSLYQSQENDLKVYKDIFS